MEFEVLKRSHVKRNIAIGTIGVLIISAIILNFTSAKYRVTDSVPLINGTINYTPYDFKIMAMYQEDDTGEYIEIEEMPGSEYIINETESYCTVDNVNKDDGAILYTNENGEHVFSGLKKNSKCYLYFDERICKIGAVACNTIMANMTNIDRRTDFSTTLKETTSGKIYKAYDDDGATYYFAGAPTDNWVSFAGFYWRIIRINGDGSVRLIYSGDSSSGPTTTGEFTQIGTSIFNENKNHDVYVGYMYGTPGSDTYEETHANINDSTIKTVLDTWYENNLLKYEKYISQDSGFCGDRSYVSGDGYGTSITAYGAYGRLISLKEPNFKCTNQNDLYTKKNSKQGNNALDYPIGLITADEVSCAGGVYGINNTDYYLFTNAEYVTLSPSDYNYNRSALFYIDPNGWINGDFGYGGNNNPIGVRPVINLRSDVEVLRGSGTQTDPYIITE